MKRFLPAVLALAFFVGCNGSDGDAPSSTESTAGGSTTTSTAKPGGDKGIGPVDHVELASLDMSRSDQGRTTFETVCSACHKLEERYIGPALNGVTQRRKPEWILNMILNTDQMLKEDPTAYGLLAEYLAPMTQQNLTREDAEAVLAFLLENDHGTGPDDVHDGAAGTTEE